MSRGELRHRFDAALVVNEANHGPLPGIGDAQRRETFIEQLIDSERRNMLFDRIAVRPVSEEAADPSSSRFDPLRAAVWNHRAGNLDEALWCVFLYVHFGKHGRTGWALVRDVVGRLGHGPPWTWATVSADVHAFRAWLDAALPDIRASIPQRAFGNHRKYESLDAWSEIGTGAVVASYVRWIDPPHDHSDRLTAILVGCPDDPRERFERVYRALKVNVVRFGRTASFDYCSTAGKLRLVDLRPGMAGLIGSTGPRAGALLLVAPDGAPNRALEDRLASLQADLDIGFDALEDALCNWQKSPDAFKPFRG